MLPLLPVSWLFYCIQALRQIAYQQQWLPSWRAALPVIVVGNIIVGGTGKTSFVIWLCQWLKTQGYTPGIVLRGVGGQPQTAPILVSADTPVTQVGDEALLLSKHTQATVI